MVSVSSLWRCTAFKIENFHNCMSVYDMFASGDCFAWNSLRFSLCENKIQTVVIISNAITMFLEQSNFYYYYFSILMLSLD